MTKTFYKVIDDNSAIIIYEQKAGQYCNPRVYSGWRYKVIKWIINNVFNRKEN